MRLAEALFSGGARRDAGLLAVLALVLFGSGLGLRSPWPPDEPRFALVAREMVQSGEWLFPHRNGELYADKPPVFFWMIGAAYRLTGSIRVAFLLPSLLAGLATVLLVYDLARRLWNRRVGLVAGLALLATVQFCLQSRAAQIDGVLTLFTTVGLYGLLRHLLLGPAWAWWYAGFAAMGLGVITKGVGFLPALVLVPYAWARARGWPGIPRFPFPARKVLAGIGVMLAVIGAWLIPMLVTVAHSGSPALAAYRDDILMRQTAQRYVAAWHHTQWFGYYLVEVAPWAWLPLSVAMPWLIPGWRRRIARRESRTALLLGWIALVVLFFSISPGKRGVYLLPAAPALALAAAPLLPGIVRRPSARTAAAWTGGILAGLFVLGGLAVLLYPDRIDATLRHYPGQAPVVAVPFLVLGVAGLYLQHRARGVAGLVGLLWTLWIVTGWWINPALDPLRSAAPMMAEVAADMAPSRMLGVVAWREQLVLESDLDITTFGYARPDLEEEGRDAAHWATSRPGRWVLLPATAAGECFDLGSAVHIGPHFGRDWYLAPPRAVVSGCGP